MEQRNDCGFTLIELMIVVVIVAVLATVAYPVYTERLAKGRQANAKSSLEAVRLCMENYRAKHGGYALPGDPMDILPGYEGVMWQSVEKGSRYELVIVQGAESSFRVQAICQPPQCNIDDDQHRDVWEINQLGKLTNTENDIDD